MFFPTFFRFHRFFCKKVDLIELTNFILYGFHSVGRLLFDKPPVTSEVYSSNSCYTTCTCTHSHRQSHCYSNGQIIGPRPCSAPVLDLTNEERVASDKVALTDPCNKLGPGNKILTSHDITTRFANLINRLRKLVWFRIIRFYSSGGSYYGENLVFRRQNFVI